MRENVIKAPTVPDDGNFAINGRFRVAVLSVKVAGEMVNGVILKVAEVMVVTFVADVVVSKMMIVYIHYHGNIHDFNTFPHTTKVVKP